MEVRGVQAERSHRGRRALIRARLPGENGFVIPGPFERFRWLLTGGPGEVLVEVTGVGAPDWPRPA